MYVAFDRDSKIALYGWCRLSYKSAFYFNSFWRGYFWILTTKGHRTTELCLHDTVGSTSIIVFDLVNPIKPVIIDETGGQQELLFEHKCSSLSPLAMVSSDIIYISFSRHKHNFPLPHSKPSGSSAAVQMTQKELVFAHKKSCRNWVFCEIWLALFIPSSFVSACNCPAVSSTLVQG